MPEDNIVKPLNVGSNPKRVIIICVVVSLILGSLTGYILANKKSSPSSLTSAITNQPDHPQQDTKTFRDFAEGVIQPRPTPKTPTEYVEGTHYLEREGAVQVALTSSVVDLSLYEGKKVKVYGETQKALKEGWLMDVGKVEEIQ